MSEKLQKIVCNLESKSTQFICSICKDIISEPHQVTCCGAVSCRECIKSHKDAQKPCWSCESDLDDSVPDTRFNRATVQCPKAYKGCQWKGEFSKVKKHLNQEPTPNRQLTGCQFYKVHCLHCRELVRRAYMQDHQNNRCLKRPFTCKRCGHESNYADITKNHEATCSKIKIPCPKGCGQRLFRMNVESHKCPEDVLDCTFKYAGCDGTFKRKNRESHMKSNKFIHDGLRKSLKDERRLQESLVLAHAASVANDPPSPLICPAELTLSNFNKYEPGNEDWYSTPFCTHSGGYKLCLKAGVRSRDDGGGKYVTLNLLLMKGRFDENLRWPLKAKFKVVLLRCGSEEGHHTDTINFRDTTEQGCSLGHRVTETERATRGPEIHNFIALAQLKEKYLTQHGKCSFRIFKNQL